MLTHRNALAFVDWAVAAIGVTAADRLSSHAPLHFDLSVFDLYAAATTYGRVGYSVTGLSGTTLHTVKVVVLGTHRTGASGSAVTVDRFAIR